MQTNDRVLTIDVMRGITLFLMLFVNDLYSPGVPGWLTHTASDFDGMGLADWVFSGFLFMVGVAVPFAIQGRLKKGETTFRIVLHIFVRTISLLFIGILMLNVSRLNPKLTGLSKNMWAILMYISVFLVWNQYSNLTRKLSFFLKGIGVICLIVLMIVFRSGTPETVSWIQTGWWGILGLIGWGYFITAFVYLVFKENVIKTGLVWLFFVGLNILSQLGFLQFLNFMKPVFGVLLGGNIPSVIMAGLFFSLILRKYRSINVKKFILIGILIGILVLISGFILRNWFIISKIKGTPSWAMICSGISILGFVILFVLIDVWGKKKWTSVFKPAGQNSLTTYLAPDILYYLIWMFSVPVLFYKQSDIPLVVVFGSLAWAFTMIGFAALLSKIGIRLKL